MVKKNKIIMETGNRVIKFRAWDKQELYNEITQKMYNGIAYRILTFPEIIEILKNRHNI